MDGGGHSSRDNGIARVQARVCLGILAAYTCHGASDRAPGQVV